MWPIKYIGKTLFNSWEGEGTSSLQRIYEQSGAGDTLALAASIAKTLPNCALMWSAVAAWLGAACKGQDPWSHLWSHKHTRT